MPDLPRTCSPGCRWCEASERLYELARILDEDPADLPFSNALFEVAQMVGRKDGRGTRMAAVILGEANP